MLRKSAVAIAAVAVALVLGFAGGVTWSGGAERAAGGGALAPRTASASIMVDFGGGEVALFPDLAVEPDTMLLGLLERVVTESGLAFETRAFEGLGVMVDSIGDKRNGENDRYWVYWVNNAEIPVGADQYAVQPGDIVLWKYTGFSNE